ncbi:MAG TPA: site-specific integrase, partial [Planctomycetota bacterium]|nr:site-specific integrase [Planctomycetota bacterium]
YLDDLRGSRSRSHVMSVEQSLTAFSAYLGPVRVRQITVPRVLARRKLRLEQGKAHATLVREEGALRACLHWALRAGLIGAHPLIHLRPLSLTEADQKRPRRALSEEEIERLLSASQRLDDSRTARVLARATIEAGGRSTEWRARDRTAPLSQSPLWTTLLATGLRWGEAAALRWSGYDVASGGLLVRASTTKGKRSRVVPVPPYLAAALSALRVAQATFFGRPTTEADSIFLTPFGKPWAATGPHYRHDLFRRTLAEAGVERIDGFGRTVDVHASRRTANTRLLRFGVPIMTAATILGHQDPKITARHSASCASPKRPPRSTHCHRLDRRPTPSSNGRPWRRANRAAIVQRPATEAVAARSVVP